MSDRERAILPAIRQAFDGDDIARKNIMLRQAHDCIRELSRSEAALEKAREALTDVYSRRKTLDVNDYAMWEKVKEALAAMEAGDE